MVKKIKISKKPTINEALKSELEKQNSFSSTLKAYPSEYDSYDDGINYSKYYEDDDDCYDYYDDDRCRENEQKEIYFYDKIDSCENAYEDNQYDYLFFNVQELKDFCTENGIHLPNSELEAIKYRKASYCTLDPLDRTEGELTLISDYSFGGLWWECHELSEEYGDKS